MNTAPRDKKEAVAATHANERCDYRQSQITQKEDEMSTTDSTNTGTMKSPEWAVPAHMRVFGPDVMHIGQAMKLERANRNGDTYFFSATPQQLEEIGKGFTTDKYVALLVDSEPFGETVLNLDIEELETIADWLCAVVEKMKP